MATLSTSPVPTSAFADALNRLRTVAHDYPTEFKWLVGIVAVFLLVFFMRWARRASTTPSWKGWRC